MSDFTIPPNAIKGRGTATRIAHRFENDVRDAFDDGWGTQEEDMIESSAPRTEVRFEIMGPGVMGWECYAVTATGERHLTSLGLLPGLNDEQLRVIRGV